MSKKIIIITMSLIFLFMINKINKKEDKSNSVNINKTEEYNPKDYLNPISKDNILQILRAEYGDISTTEDEIKISGDYYIVDVYVEVRDSEEKLKEHENLGKHTHSQSLGRHKINMYTGEVTLEP